jgi:putative hydrolase
VSDNGPLDPFDGIPDPEPEDTPNQPFAGIPLFGDLSGLLGNQPGFNWDAARQLAISVATEQKPEANTDPLARARIEELGRLVEMQLADLTQLPTIGGVTPIKLEVVTRAEWAAHTLNDYKSLLEKLNNSLAGKPDEQDDTADAHFLDGLMQMLSPMLMVMTAGSMVGHLAARAFGDYELPIPRPRHSLRLVAHNIDGFAEQWSLDPDEVRLWQCLEQMTLHSVLSIEHVKVRLTELLEEYASNFSQDPDAMQNKIAELDVDPTGGDMMAQMQAMLGNPEVLLGAVTSPRQQQLLPEIQGLIGLVLAYTDHIVDLGGARMIGAVDRLTEAVRRHRLDSAAEDQFVERLLGIQISVETLEIGNQFIAGVVERSGADGLRRLWSEPANLPTPAEMQAPGLWLARIDLPTD